MRSIVRIRLLYRGNLYEAYSQDATEDDVRGHLSQGGKVESFRMVFDKETLQPKGYGFCDFADPDTAITAIKILSEKECNGRLLRLDLADNDP